MSPEVERQLKEAGLLKGKKASKGPYKPKVQRREVQTIEDTPHEEKEPTEKQLQERATWAKPRRPYAQVSTWQPEGEPRRVTFDLVPEDKIEDLLRAAQVVLPTIYIP